MSFSKKIIILVFFLFIFSFLFSIFPVFADEELPSPIGNVTVPQIIARVIKIVLGLVGVLALIMFIYGGILWMTSGGNVEQVKKGKATLVWATLGLAIIFLAYSLVYFIITKITQGTTPTGP